MFSVEGGGDLSHPDVPGEGRVAGVLRAVGERGAAQTQPATVVYQDPASWSGAPLSNQEIRWRARHFIGRGLRERALLHFCRQRFGSRTGARCGCACTMPFYGSDVSVSPDGLHVSPVGTTGVPLTHGADTELENIASYLSPSRFPNP